MIEADDALPRDNPNHPFAGRTSHVRSSCFAIEVRPRMAVHLSDAFEFDELPRSENRRMSLNHHDNHPAGELG
jgi:hypothetical protein